MNWDSKKHDNLILQSVKFENHSTDWEKLHLELEEKKKKEKSRKRWQKTLNAIFIITAIEWIMGCDKDTPFLNIFYITVSFILLKFVDYD